MESGPALKAPAKKRKMMLKSIPQVPVTAKKKNAPADNSMDNPVPSMLLPPKNLKMEGLTLNPLKSVHKRKCKGDRQTETVRETM